MSTMALLPKDHPLMQAYDLYRSTEEYANSKRWASHVHKDEHLEGSLWSLFAAGWQAAQGSTLPKEQVAAMVKSRLFQQFLQQKFWHAHHVDVVWRYNGQDVREEADWLKDIWYAVRPKPTVEELERLLASSPDGRVEIQTNGEIRFHPSDEGSPDPTSGDDS